MGLMCACPRSARGATYCGRCRTQGEFSSWAVIKGGLPGGVSTPKMLSVPVNEPAQECESCKPVLSKRLLIEKKLIPS
ncbi:hypothetical protein AV530_016523 [Patagioenas fasciata monilis]|uniref:Uncharacterized protein n=1 Tax=Patagioenas fasciata monilis TaxID=372326 RepID=A0A1V4J370_PATFA|nr:hypothetical protein AV530_016523 [Patagioenas fasciata monilis]